jgi:hypothetical protein
VERFYTEGGYLYPEYNVFYWFGLVSNATVWPSFRWQDRSFPAPNATSYRNWGVLTVPQADGTAIAFPEPNRYQFPNEYCGGANATEMKMNAWGWADAFCDLNFTAICRMAAKGPCSLPPYTDRKTGSTYLYNSNEVVQGAAEQWCNDHGGHLVSYESLEEQVRA